jgi:Ser/Thr protein kinase RdoA (MazF antagonist)
MAAQPLPSAAHAINGPAPFGYSRLSPQGALAHLLPAYALARDTRCHFFAAGLHDNYLVEDSAGKYILRVYRAAWRTREEILFELELLDYLHRQGAPVAAAKTTQDGHRYVTIDCPEGPRSAALFSFAPGSAPGAAIDRVQSRVLGRAVANVHRLADGYQPAHARPPLDLALLLDSSVLALGGFLNTTQRAYLEQLQEKIQRHLPTIPRVAPFYGPCAGDINANNFHVTESGKITLFDFDQCGYGWRAFEMGKFFAATLEHAAWAGLREGFRLGYESARQLQPVELRALPYLTLVADIWVMGIHARNADYLGYRWLQADFWVRKIARLKRLEETTALWAVP